MKRNLILYLVLLITPGVRAEWDLSDYSGFAEVGPTYTAEYPDQAAGVQFPQFSWDTVPRWLAVRNNSPLSNEEVSSIATNYQLVMLEKENRQGLSTVEAGVLSVAGRIKAVNPDCKTLFYWNAKINYLHYAANVEYEQNKWDWSTLEVIDGVTNIYLFKDKYYWYDFDTPGMRDWWVDTALGMVANDAIDGVFIDAIAKTPNEAEGALYTNGVPATDYMLMADALAQGMPPGKMLVGNALRNEQPNGQRTHMTYLDGSYLERWDFPMNGTSQSDADAIAVSIQLMREALSKGKMINLQSGPPDTDNLTQEYVAEQVDFPLAVFLIVAETNAFFSYQSSVHARDASWRWDTSWIEELNHPLGAPLGDPVRNGTIYMRSYPYVDVWVDISTKQTVLTWRDVPLNSGIIGRDNFDGTGIYESRTINQAVNNANNLWKIVSRQTVGTEYVIDTSVAAGGVIALDAGDTLGFLGTNKIDNVFGMYRGNAAQSLVYTFNVSNYSDLSLEIDWAISGDIADKNITVKYSIDGGSATTLFDVGTSGTDWTEIMDIGTVTNRNRSASVWVNGASAAMMTDTFQTYSPTIAGTGTVLTVTIAMASTVGGFGGAGLDNLKLYGTAPGASGFSTWIAGYGLSGTNATETANPEGDPFSNHEEYIAGLNPTIFDTFAISNFTAGTNNAFEWIAMSGRVYNVYWSSNLLDGFSRIESNALNGAFIDTNNPTKPEGFYKITVEIEP
jgi:hypothetical protein